jgi:hypothetical protein
MSVAMGVCHCGGFIPVGAVAGQPYSGALCYGGTVNLLPLNRSATGR